MVKFIAYVRLHDFFTNFPKISLRWYTISPVVVTFLKKYDLSGKKIYPFATNAGWLGHTFPDFKKLCPNSNVINEKNIVFESYSSNLVTSTEEINDWIEKI